MGILIEGDSRSDIVGSVFVVSPGNVKKAITSEGHASGNVYEPVESNFTEELLNEHLLTPLRCYGCSAAILEATVEQVDAIVSRGIRNLDIRLEDQQ